MARILVMQRGVALEEHSLATSRLSIGRAASNDIVINDGSCSRFHARIVGINDNYFLEDLKSSNGTLVNNQEITKVDLKDGDLIFIGERILWFQESEQESDNADPVQCFMMPVGMDDPAAPKGQEDGTLLASDRTQTLPMGVATVAGEDEVEDATISLTPCPVIPQEPDRTLGISDEEDGGTISLVPLTKMVVEQRNDGDVTAHFETPPPPCAEQVEDATMQFVGAAPPPFAGYVEDATVQFGMSRSSFAGSAGDDRTSQIPPPAQESEDATVQFGGTKGEAPKRAEVKAGGSGAKWFGIADDYLAAVARIPRVDIFFQGVMQGEYYLLTDCAIAGRSHECDIYLDEADTSCSRHHARITRHGGQYLVEDLVSANGIYLNDRPVSQGRLQGGDRIDIGDHRLVFHAPVVWHPSPLTGSRLDQERIQLLRKQEKILRQRIEKSADPKELHRIGLMLTRVQLQLQQAGGERPMQGPRGELPSEFWQTPKCSCPKPENEAAWVKGGIAVVDGGCPFHGMLPTVSAEMGNEETTIIHPYVGTETVRVNYSPSEEWERPKH